MRPNRLRQRLDAGQPSLGTHILSCWPTLVELVGQADAYDYVEFTAEYGPFTMHDLDNLGRGLELAGLAGMIKVEQTQWTHQAMRAIGSGFQSVLFADVRTVADARACVAAVRAETPAPRRGQGLLGVGMRRDVGTIREAGTPAYVEALDNAVVAIMVEKRQCVEDLDAILSVPGIDMVQFGPADYSMSIGRAGQLSHPDVRKAEQKTIETALKKGIHPRAEISEPSEASRYVEMGVKHFCIGWDVDILHGYWRTRGQAMQDLLVGLANKSSKARRQAIGGRSYRRAKSA
jgi:2-keto-3-deoxy-L-rhamnonate aldolase RhmA